MREKMLGPDGDPFLMQKPHYEYIDILRKSELFKCF
jgi:hypothetical protein